MFCGSKYTPEKKQHGYDAKVRKQAIRLYVDGMNLRRTARHLGVHHSTVSTWVKEYVKGLPQAPQPKKVKIAEMDELFTFIGKKKTKSTS
jgi:insertion element IS1 protein InsB